MAKAPWPQPPHGNPGIAVDPGGFPRLASIPVEGVQAPSDQVDGLAPSLQISN